jgi:hypothetical protein
MKKLIFTLALLAGISALAQPNTPFPNLLTGQTPFNHTTPSGWTLYASENFENGTCSSNSGAYCNGIFNTLQHHNDGNPSDTHSMGCTYGNYVAGALPCNSSVSWNRPLPVGTRQVYLSWYEWIDSTFRMNDEMFLTRFWWNQGTGQPTFREAILDYFQDSTGTYNSADATLLWNIQGQPYYQNKLPSNTRGDNTNFSITTGSWVQHEIYMLFSTVLPLRSVGSVTFNATSHTYTRASGSWIADGVTIGSSPHFTGFTNSWNNGSGDAGGGGSSYFVTALTDTVMTVTADCCNATTNETASVSYQVDVGNGAYAYYKNGTVVAYQNNMVSPGLVDFASQATNVSIGESYSKLIWRAHVNGNCETQATAPPAFTGACQSSIGNGGCGFEQIPLGWNGSGLTQSAAGSGYNTHIDCDATWSGPMPTPPVFNRYVDDLLVLTQASTTPPTPVAAAVLTSGVDGCSNPTQTVAFPAYGQFTLNAGTVANCGAGGNTDSGFPSQGITSYFDLKNDPAKAFDFGAADTGIFEHQWGIKNQDGTTRYNEIKEGPMAITVTESNNVRVKLSQSGAVRSVGNLSNTADCCMTMTKSYVFYRHGGNTSGSGAAKVYTKTTINYNNGDSQAPLTTAGTPTGINYYGKIAWWKVSGEANKQTNPCPSAGSLGTFTLSPWNIIYPGTQGTNVSKDYVLYSPVNANDTNATEFLPANPCTSPASVNPGPENTTSGQPQPGTVMLCNGATNTACVSQSAAAVSVKANFLQIEQEQQCSFMSIGTQNYFLGGLRTYCALASQTFPANTPRSWTSVGFIGDNGITSDGSASTYVTEYKSPPTITFLTGSTAAFDPVEGYWTMAAATNAVSFSANGVLHSPAFNISSFASSAPTQIQVGSSTLVKDTGYVAVKTDSTHLLLQILSDIASGTNIQVIGNGGTQVTVTPSSATIPKSGSAQFSASTTVTWTVDGSCTGSISSTGIFTATSTAETCVVTGTAGSSIGTASVTVTSLSVSPATIPLNVGASQQFSANFASTWTASCGTISASGLYTAPQVNGSCTITATAVNGGSTATATATVSGALTNVPLVLSPTSWNYGTVVISTPSSKSFTASNIGTGSVTPTVTLTGSGTFSITANTCSGAVAGGGNCSITVQFLSAAAGSFAGNIQVTDTAGGNTNIPLSATVASAPIVSVTPKTVTLPKLGVQSFSASVAVTWTADCGTITPGGTYTAPNVAETCIVTGTAAPSSDNANVTVQAVAVNPIAVTLVVSAKQTFTANFPVTWAASCGTITSAGVYTAPAAATSCVVTATAVNGGSTGTSSVSVVPAPPTNPGGKVKGGKGNPGKFH